MPTELEQEYKVYLDHRQQFLRRHCHKFVLIKGQKVVDFFPSYEEALKAGLRNFGNTCFFIKEVCRKEEEHLV